MEIKLTKPECMFLWINYGLMHTGRTAMEAKKTQNITTLPESQHKLVKMDSPVALWQIKEVKVA